MKTIKLVALFILSTLVFTSCKKDPVETPVEPVSKLGFIKTAVLNDEDSDGFAQIGETISYTFDIKNTGNVTISNITITDERIGVVDLALDPSTLYEGEQATITVAYTIGDEDTSGEIVNQAIVSGEDVDSNLVTDLSDDDSYEEDGHTITSFDLTEVGPFANGYFIVNEGSYGSGNASISFVGLDGSVTQNVYSTVNGEALGDTAQSIFMHEDKAYIIINGSNKIEIVNRYTMENIGTITGAAVQNPRYMVAVGNTGYLSNWGVATDATDDFIAIIDLSSNTVTGTISINEGPEDMLATDDKVYVNLQGGWSQNNQVVVIDALTNTISSSIEVNDVPSSIVEDATGNVWVLCSGKPSWTGDETAASIVKIEGETLILNEEFATTQHPQHMTMIGNDLYYNLNGEVFAKSTTGASILEPNPSLSGYYYGMKGHEGKLYTLDAVDYSSEGILRVFDIAAGTLDNTLTTGIVPNGVAFN